MKAASFSISWYALVISAKGASSCGGRYCPPYLPKNPASSGTARRLAACSASAPWTVAFSAIVLTPSRSRVS